MLWWKIKNNCMLIFLLKFTGQRGNLPAFGSWQVLILDSGPNIFNPFAVLSVFLGWFYSDKSFSVCFPLHHFTSAEACMTNKFNHVFLVSVHFCEKLRELTEYRMNKDCVPSFTLTDYKLQHVWDTQFTVWLTLATLEV